MRTISEDDQKRFAQLHFVERDYSTSQTDQIPYNIAIISVTLDASQDPKGPLS
jgi:hypothetical protein